MILYIFTSTFSRERGAFPARPLHDLSSRYDVLINYVILCVNDLGFVVTKLPKIVFRFLARDLAI